MGFLLDIGVTLDVQFIIFAIYIFICSIGLGILTPNLLIGRSPSDKFYPDLLTQDGFRFLKGLKIKKVRIPDNIPGATS